MANTIDRNACEHTGEMKVTSTDKIQCEQCDITEHLRLCTSCGVVLCCQSGNAHNEAHYEETGHPIIMSVPTGTPLSFTWCWKDNAYLKKE